ncbi:hypothetical protein, partial [Amycolatopsis rhizosphaerae]|uniref:hypothetical protein n=1 Tax=Amycolatopsis rhizosphaerae TaxID=2053003 RepID=UPI0016439596
AAPRYDEGSQSGFLSVSGRLPLPEQASPASPVSSSVPSPTPPPRTRVRLTAPTCHEAGSGDDVRVYVAPPETGLSTFDLGSVPASVTPPRSWRRAAWFATASSGGVVVALLFAGSALVGKPAPEQASGGWVPGLGGGLPTVAGEQLGPGPLARYSGPGTNSSSTLSTQLDPSRSSSGPAAVRDTGESTSAADSDAAPRPSAPSDPAGSAPLVTSVPPKPAPTPAPYDSDPFQLSLQQADPGTLARTSQRYLDSVTANPAQAHELTTGELRDEGTEGLAEKYSEVAYFEVEHIQVHQYDGRTVCTVKTVHKNGRQTVEQRTLTFDGTKISSDGN